MVREKIRVTVIEPGMTSTGIFEKILNEVWREQWAATVGSIETLQPEDIAAAIRHAVTQPPHVNVNEILIRPQEQER